MANGNSPRYGRCHGGSLGHFLLLFGVLLGVLLVKTACNSSQNYNLYAAGTKENGRGLSRGAVAKASSSSQAQVRLQGVVTHVSDGDTADFRPDGGNEIRLRFFGIDAPENSQEFGGESRRYATKRLLKQRVEVIVRNDDQYGRKVSTVYLNGKDFCLELIALGYAWHWARYYDNPEYARAMQQAQTSKVGLWGAAATAGHEAIPPWEYRKANPRRSKTTKNN